MLGSLARWLRLLGYDALYVRDVDDEALVARARREKRLLVTRDRALASRRKAAPALCLRSRGLRAQWVELARACDLRPPPRAALTRCAVCNLELEPLPRPAARALVPAYVHATRRRFRRCPGCGRVFWRATHHHGLSERLRALRLLARQSRRRTPALRRRARGRERRARRSP